MGLPEVNGFHSMVSVSSGILDSSPSADERQSKKSKVCDYWERKAFEVRSRLKEDTSTWVPKVNE